MTPQLQQAIKLLQLSRQELIEEIQTQLVENPILEEADDFEPHVDAADPRDAMPLETVESDPRQREETQMAERVEDIDWERYLENYSSPLPASSGGRDDEMPGYEQTITNSEGLAEYLLDQLGLLETNEAERAIAAFLIYNLDEDGYLRDFSIEEIAIQLVATHEDVEDALEIVQQLDPPGVGARTLAECLSLQARFHHPHNLLLRRVAEQHIDDLVTRNYAGIARALGATREEVLDAVRILREFEPKPGRPFAEDAPRYIVPDIYIVKQNDDWVAMLNDDGLPRLRVSDYYQRTLRRSSEKDARNYIHERLRSARWLIRSIQQRQRTILRVTESIIAHQREFLDQGIHHLRPLVLREVAEDIGMHESTVSRVTTNKYVHTPRGMFELKFFFNSSIRRGEGEDVAAEAVKQHIKEIIRHENSAHPLSDQVIVEMLKQRHDIEIARRTVAKYREGLGILSSSRRRRVP